MKHNLYILFIISTLIFATSCGPTPKEADRYNRQLTAWQHQVKFAGDSLEKAFRTFDSVLIEKKLKRAELITKRNINALKQKGKLKNDASLYKAHLKYVMIYDTVLHQEYTQMLNLYRLPDEKYGIEGDKKFQKLQTAKNRKLKKAFLELSITQNEFAERYNLKLKKKVK